MFSSATFDITARRDSVVVLGSRIHLVSVADSVDQMECWIRNRDGRCRRIVVTGFHGIWAAHQDHELKSILNSAEIWVPDGIAPVWVARLKDHRRKISRATGAEIMHEFLRRASDRGYRSYFYGDTDATLAALRQRLECDFPGHVVAGTFSPPFRPLTQKEDEEIVERINAARPDVLWVGLGMPKQDRWIFERRARLRVPVAIGVGAAFAFMAGTVKRCPEWIGRIGMEWGYRFYKEPKKLWRRDLIDGPRFLFHLGLELTGIRTYD